MSVGHVLVVDDNPVNRRILIRNLERDGHEVSAAENGLQAMVMLADTCPDVVLLDILMPELDGFGVLERMKADPQLRHVPVVMISAVEDTASIVRCIEMGADDYLPKPFDSVILRARIDAGLNRSRLRDLERQQVRSAFTRFLPEPIVDEMLARGDGTALIAATRLTATVMFTDLRGFTSFSEGRDVEQVVEVLNDYLGSMGDAVLDHGGTLVAYTGDGLMAAFGAPVESDDHADRALDAVREIISKRLPAFNARLARDGLADGFRMGIGLNTGPMMSSSVGSERRTDYTVIGDTVNTASRIEQLTKQAGHPVLVAASTKNAALGPVDDLSYVDEFPIRGRERRIELWGIGSHDAS
jgi:class 3 adenylate cyclase